MYKTKEIFKIDEQLENLRDKINIQAVKILNGISNEEYGVLLDLSRKLDDVIADYAKRTAKNSKSYHNVKKLNR